MTCFLGVPKKVANKCNAYGWDVFLTLRDKVLKTLLFGIWTKGLLFFPPDVTPWRSAEKSTCTFRRLMNCTHSTQVVRKGSKQTAHLPNPDSIVCISGRSSEGLDTIDGLFKCSFRINLAACSCEGNNVISCQYPPVQFLLFPHSCFTLNRDYYHLSLLIRFIMSH